MDPNATDPGVATPPVEPAAPAAPAPSSTPPASEGVKDSGRTVEQSVPYQRFQEVNDRAKAAEEELARYRAEQAQPKTDDIEPETLDIIKRSATKLGFVSKEELDAREARIQVQQDISDLTGQYKDSGVPFDGRAVIAYAQTNGIPIGSKQSLDAVYKQMNYDAIVEAQRKAAVDAYISGFKNAGEKPGSAGAKAPEEPKPAGLKDRIRMAREKAGVSI